MASLTGLRSRPLARRLGVAALVVALAVLPLMATDTVNGTLARIGVYAVAVLGLNVVMGYTGQVYLGQIFWVGLGAYATAYGANHDWPVALTFLVAALLSALIGLLVALAAARLGGLAIAMVTIALPIVGVPLAKRLSSLTGGSQGTSAQFSSAPSWTYLYDDQWQLYIVLAIGGVTFLLTRNFLKGKFGRALAIVKNNEAVAGSMGISPYAHKVLASTIAALIGGVSGFLYMFVLQYTSPETLHFGHSITLVAAMVIGGAGSIVGSLLGGAYYVLVPQLTNVIDPSLTAVLGGAILLGVLFLLPGGLVTLPRALRRRAKRARPVDDDRIVGPPGTQQSAASATIGGN